MATSDAIIRLRELVGEGTIVMLTSETPSGELHSRPLTLSEIDDTGALVFLVDGTADWVAGLRADEQVNVSLADDDGRLWVSIPGRARVGEDQATIHRLWTPAVEVYFPDGVDSPDVRVLSVTAGRVEYWDAPASRVRRLADMAGSLLGRSDSTPGESGTIDLR